MPIKMGYYRNQTQMPVQRFIDTSEATVDLGDKLDVIFADELRPVSDTTCKEVKLVMGYNWIDKDQPAMVVPGTSYAPLPLIPH